jgi:hypothetical protein
MQQLHGHSISYRIVIGPQQKAQQGTDHGLEKERTSALGGDLNRSTQRYNL